MKATTTDITMYVRILQVRNAASAYMQDEIEWSSDFKRRQSCTAQMIH